MPCYSGPNPVTDEDRIAIWKWAKENGIDHGLPFDKVHNAINQHFFSGQAKPDWITDILSGRKTPFRQLANDAWRKQYNRRQTILIAKDAVRDDGGKHPIYNKLKRLWNFPREAAVFGHGIVFPITHAGDLALRPQSWGVFFRGLLNTYTKAGSSAATERILDTMKRQPLFDTALRSGLDVGERSTGRDLVANKSLLEKIPMAGKVFKWQRELSENAWSVLTAMRYELWDHEVQKFIKPGMTETEILDIGKNLAEWANHATGSAKGGISSIKGVSNVVFGPKLTQSKLNRVFADPVKTLNTFANWGKASAGEKAAAWTRLHGLTQYAVAYNVFLGINQGLLWATHQKDKEGKDLKVNFLDPTKGDWMNFKGFGLEMGIPGIHSELKALGKILATAFMDSKAVKKKAHGGTKFDIAKDTLIDYAFSKGNPVIQVAGELYSGHETWGLKRPTPLSDDKGTAKKPPMGWTEYALSHGPIPLTGPVRYFYDELRANGSSAMDAVGITKALIIGGVGLSGLHIREDYEAARDRAKRDQAANMLLQRR